MNFMASNSDVEFEFYIGFHKSVYTNEKKFVLELKGNNIYVHPPKKQETPIGKFSLTLTPKPPKR